MSTKQNGDVAEYRTITELLARGFNVLVPCGDRLPYDIAVDLGHAVLKIQVKRAWPILRRPGTYAVDIRRSQTNRRVYKYTKYAKGDFDLLIAWVPEIDTFYVIPSEAACAFGSAITLSDGSPRHRVGKAEPFRSAWHLIA